MKILLFVIGFLFVLMMFFHPKKASLQLDHWSAYKMEFNKQYSQEEDNFRRAIFKEKMKEVDEINSQNLEYEFGINQFSDMTQYEFEQKMLTLLPTPNGLHREKITLNGDSVDWRDKGAVSDVKDQGYCGSCWAFSAVGNLEGVNFIFGGKKLDLYSEQQLVDCSWDYGNMGCNGGLMTYAFEYVIDHGITSEAKYPYAGVDQKCKIDGGDFKISSYEEIDSGDCDQQKEYIKKMPTSVAVDASRWSSYKSGIFSNCGKSLNHGVTAVGYNDEYWIIKNSWGHSWGEKGYMRLKIGNTCGVCDMSASSVI